MENSCPKCGGVEIDKDDLRMSGSGFTRYFNIQNRMFETHSCKHCGYTEFYKQTGGSLLSSIFDFFTG